MSTDPIARLVAAAERVVAARNAWHTEGGGRTYRRLVQTLAELDRAVALLPPGGIVPACDNTRDPDDEESPCPSTPRSETTT